MVICPNCGAKFSVANPNAAGKARKKSDKTELAVQLVKCPVCQTRFLSKEQVPQPRLIVNVKNGIERIKAIEDELMQTLQTLREKIQALEAERAVLLEEIQKLKTAAESRASALEGEVGQMREEVKSLKELLGSDEPKAASPV